MSRSDQRDHQGWDGADAPGGASPRPEPGAGSAGRGAAERRRLDTGVVVVSAPKSRASSRTVAVPAAILPAIRAHLDGCVGHSPDSLVFTGSRGGVLRRSNFRRTVKWSNSVAAIGAPGLHFHDLRHTGNTHAAATGASLRDLMDRMGHDSARAALIYQHKKAAAAGRRSQRR